VPLLCPIRLAKKLLWLACTCFPTLHISCIYMYLLQVLIGGHCIVCVLTYILDWIVLFNLSVLHNNYLVDLFEIFLITSFLTELCVCFGDFLPVRTLYFISIQCWTYLCVLCDWLVKNCSKLQNTIKDQTYCCISLFICSLRRWSIKNHLQNPWWEEKKPAYNFHSWSTNSQFLPWQLLCKPTLFFLVISGIARKWKGEQWLPQQYHTENALLWLQRNWASYFQPILQVCNLLGLLRQTISIWNMSTLKLFEMENN